MMLRIKSMVGKLGCHVPLESRHTETRLSCHEFKRKVCSCGNLLFQCVAPLNNLMRAQYIKKVKWTSPPSPSPPKFPRSSLSYSCMFIKLDFIVSAYYSTPYIHLGLVLCTERYVTTDALLTQALWLSPHQMLSFIYPFLAFSVANKLAESLQDKLHGLNITYESIAGKICFLGG